MKGYIALVLIICAGLIHARAQCTIDFTQTAAGIYPDTLPQATAGQPYDVDVTFVMLTDTLGLTIFNYQITNVAGLPVGLTWQCNNFANGCNYDPAVSLYGCVDISGTPVIPGNFIMTVTVVADVQLAGSQSISFDVPLTVLPGTVNNPGFSMVNAAGCAPLTVTVVNNNPGQATYAWDFGNGLQSNLENPPPQVYNNPGTYVITQTVTPAVTPSWYLTEVTVSSIPNNYGGIVDDPDMYFLLYDPLGTEVYDSRPDIDGTFPPVTWAVPNIPLQNGNYTIHVWDEDGGLFGADDDLGEITFAGNGTSGSATGTVSGASGQLIVEYNIFQTPVVPLTATDTVYVYETPDTPSVLASGPLTFCEDDSLILFLDDSVNAIQWYDGGNVLAGVTGQNFTPSASGNYYAVVTTLNGCTAVTAPSLVTINPLPAKPTFFVTGNNFTTGIGGINLQWYLNGVAIPGADSTTYFAVANGTYQLCATDTNGCTNCSDTLAFVGTGISGTTGNGFSIYPNPSSGRFTILMDHADEGRIVFIYDTAGRIIKRISSATGLRYVHHNKLEPGLYVIAIQEKGGVKYSRLVVR